MKIVWDLQYLNADQSVSVEFRLLSSCNTPEPHCANPTDASWLVFSYCTYYINPHLYHM